jgi:hypothetical protein
MATPLLGMKYMRRGLELAHLLPEGEGVAGRDG